MRNLQISGIMKTHTTYTKCAYEVIYPMPVYTYRREDGTTFDLRQKFNDDPLTVDPATGQRVVRVVQAAGIVFKGSGFYVNDSKDASRKSINSTGFGFNRYHNPCC
jgi:putative FmdB family regulatory protein